MRRFFVETNLSLQHEKRAEESRDEFYLHHFNDRHYGMGIIIPVIPTLIEELINGDISEAAKYGGWLSFAYAYTQFIFSPVVGNLSDKFGRRPINLISLFVFTIDYIFLALAPTIWLLFVGRIIAGITGANITTASAYIADVSTDEDRAKNFGLIGAAFRIGFIIGLVIGVLLGEYGSIVPFYAAAVLCLLNFLYGYFVLPESLDQDKRRDFSWKRANPIVSFNEAILIKNSYLIQKK